MSRSPFWSMKDERAEFDLCTTYRIQSLSRRGRWRSSLLAAALVLSPLAAGAQPARSEIEAAKREAVAIADKGVDAFRAQKYETAIAAFRTADAKFHVPKFLLYVARSQAKLGKLIDARATYQSVVDEKLPPYAPGEFFTAQAEAKKELEELDKRIPTVVIEVRGLGAGQLPVITIDGASVSPGDLGKPLRCDPGPRTIVVTSQERPSVTRNVDLREGASETLTIDMSAAPPGASAGDSAGSKGSSVPALTIATWTIGAAGLVTFGVMGGLALGKHTEYNSHPTREALDQGRLFSLIADIGIGTAVAGAAVGTIYWLVTRPKNVTSSQAPRPALAVAPVIGSETAGAVLSGRF